MKISDSENKDGPIYAIFPLPEKEDIPQNFYKSLEDTGVDIPDCDEQGEFWKSKNYGSNFAYVPFGKKQIIEVLKQIINYMSIVEFVPIDL